MPSRESSSFSVGWIAALVVYFGLLVYLLGPTVPDPAQTPTSVWELQPNRAGRDWIPILVEAASATIVHALMFLPLGVFAALGFPKRRSALGRFTGIFVPAAIVATLLAVAAVGSRIGSPESLRELVALSVGAASGVLGAALGTAASHGLLALILFFPKLAVVAVVVLGGGFLLTTSPAPLQIERPQVSSEDRRHLVRLFQGHNPMKLREGETRSVVIEGRDIELLAASGLSLIGAAPRVEVTTLEGRMEARGSAHIPVVDRYLNVDLDVRPAVDQGNLEFAIRYLRLGALRVPGPVLSLFSWLTETILQKDESVGIALAGVDELRVDPDGIAVSYRRMDLGGRFADNVLARLGPDEEVLKAARAQLEHLSSSAPAIRAAGEGGFETALTLAFSLARDRSQDSNPIVENSGAILALASVLGHPGLSVFAGLESEMSTIRGARRYLRGVTLRGRRDWTQHFLVSAGLVQLSSVAVSDAVGVLKEELDADMDEGGSGFSFADLLADRAGTMFSRRATRDVEAADELQESITEGFAIGDIFPPADGLAEGIADADLTREYGGVNGYAYTQVIDDIEQRLETCALLH